MKRIIFFLFSYFFFYSAFYSQNQLDSLKLKFQKDSAHTFRFKKIRPFFTIDQRNSWIKNEKGLQKVPVTINGIQLGVILKEKHSLGLGLYTMNGTSKKPVKINDQNNRITYQELLLKYLTVNYQYVIFDTRFFEMDLPLEVGIGNYIYTLKDETQTALLWREAGPLKLTGGGVNIVLKPVIWIGITGMAGYRIVAFNKKTNLNFNGIYYSYGVWIDVRQIYRDIKFYGFIRHKYRKKVKALSASKS